MSNPNEHIESFLKYYFQLKTAPYYAVLLKGRWGVGKTWFLREVIKSLDDPDSKVKKYLYVSLYGITSFEEIENEFFRQLHPVLSSKGMALAGKIAKGLLKTTLKIDIDGDGKSDSTITSQIPDIELPEYLSNTEGLILVFDDLERSLMGMESLLGYINYFVEHQGYKVILIANEEELFAKEEKNEANYKRIKEKLIGKTFEVQPQLDNAVKNFTLEIESQSARSFFDDNIELISDYYIQSEYWNLRHLRQALMDFSRLYDEMLNENRIKEDLSRQLLSIFLLLSFEIKSGNILPEDILEFRSLYIGTLVKASEDVVSDNIYTRICNKYPLFSIDDLLLEESIWVEIFSKGIYNKDKINKSLKNSKFFLSETQEDWIKLWHYIDLNDDEFIFCLNNVLEKLYKEGYEKIGIIKHVTGILMFLSDIGLVADEKNKILEKSKRCIDNLVNNNKILSQVMSTGVFDDGSWGGLGYYKDSEEFKELCQYIEYNIKEQRESKHPEIGEIILNAMESEIEKFYQIMSGEIVEYRNIAILKSVNPEIFVQKFLKLHPRYWTSITIGIYHRYIKDYSGLRNKLYEISWLQEVVYLLNEEIQTRNGKLSQFQISSLLKNYLIPALQVLYNAEPLPRDPKNYKWFPYDTNISLLKVTSLSHS